jgi:hypothetical protein
METETLDETEIKQGRLSRLSPSSLYHQFRPGDPALPPTHPLITHIQVNQRILHPLAWRISILHRHDLPQPTF